ncbi:MAG: carbon starvation CstA 5TM domain-containing protein [candidate division Zixibacteria bacterium]
MMLTISWTNSYRHIWPLFGSTNQLLAALALIAVTFWLHRARKPTWFTICPAAMIVVTTTFSLVYKPFADYIPNLNYFLAVIDVLLLVLAIGMTRLSIRKLAEPEAAPESQNSVQITIPQSKNRGIGRYIGVSRIHRG